MGGQNSKDEVNGHSGLLAEEEAKIRVKFSEGSKGNQCTESDLQEMWKDRNNHLCKVLCNYLLKDKEVDFFTFIKPYKFIVKGSFEEKQEFLAIALKHEKELRNEDIIKYVESFIFSFITLPQHVHSCEEWKVAGCKLSDERVLAVGKYLCRESPLNPVDPENFKSWISSWSSLKAMEKAVFEDLYGTTDLEVPSEVTIPMCLGLPSSHQNVSILDLADIALLNSRLPKEVTNEWRVLFSTKIHGESFSKLLGCIVNEGPSLVIVEDKSGHVFGGFASESWHLGPHFYGNAASFLFTLKPDINMFYPSGYNGHFQYLNVQQQTLPNGLGMGGQFEYFGFWLDALFGKGSCSETCTTYKDYKMLSGEKYFEINHVEIWGTGKKPEKKDEEGERTILDDPKYWETKAMLEMAGRSQHSEGLREPED